MKRQPVNQFSRISILITVALTCSAASTGCTSQQGYASAQSWQRSECNKLLDQSERERCMANASMPYDDYKRESGKAK